jgi:chromatin structure-remodeling complex subunit RSC1/2
VLWFASPPVDVARLPAPRHSLAYLHHLAMKRKAAMARVDGDDPRAMRTDEADEETRKRARVVAPPRTTDAINELYAQIFGD